MTLSAPPLAGAGCRFLVAVIPIIRAQHHYAVDVHASAAGLAAGTYHGKIVLTDSNNHSINVTVQVTLNVVQRSAAFLDNLPGALSFSFTTGGHSSAQSFQIRNAGSGTLNWKLSASTADGGNWLGASSSSGTAPSMVSVSITPGKLPDGGLVAGTFAGKLTVQTSGDSITIPISVTVGNSALEQVNPISFTMPVGRNNPLPQVLTIDTADNSATKLFHRCSGREWRKLVVGSGLQQPKLPVHYISSIYRGHSEREHAYGRHVYGRGDHLSGHGSLDVDQRAGYA